MTRTISDVVRNSPFGSPFSRVECEGLKVNEARTVSALSTSAKGRVEGEDRRVRREFPTGERFSGRIKRSRTFEYHFFGDGLSSRR